MKKRIIISIAVFLIFVKSAALAIGYLWCMKLQIEEKIVIHASAERVWEQLTDF